MAPSRRPSSHPLSSHLSSGGHFMNTAEKIRLPDDCTVGYIIEWVLGVPLTRSNLFHSHLENLQQVSRPEIHKQVRGRPARRAPPNPETAA